MKKAFTMIEIIFAIVIIGVLATIATPKLFGSRQDAQILLLKEKIAAIRSGIEANAQNKLYETGVKKYPKSLCSNSDKCNFQTGEIFQAVLSKAEKSGIKERWNGWATNVDYEAYVYYPNIQDRKNGYVFQYNNDKGTFKCIDNYSNFPSNKLKCKDLGEISYEEETSSSKSIKSIRSMIKEKKK